MRSSVYCLQGLVLWISLLISAVESITVYANGVRYVGVQNYTSGINTFWGIRYAQPPIGDLRWREPQPFKPKWWGISSVRATDPGPACWQSTPAWRADTKSPLWQDEDCLLLNIQAPMNKTQKRLPVLVMIHGGGYLAGSAQYSTGEALLQQANGTMVYVSLQYRLGALGFLGGDAVRADGTLNAGLLDQRAGLEWIRNNIQYFGGDPSRITITGSSAGGGSVAMHMIMFGGRHNNPPFQAAIPEFPWWTPMYGNEWMQDQYKRFLSVSACDSLGCLRNLTMPEINAATRNATESAYYANKYPFGTFYWGPTIDGRIIESHPHQAFREGQFTKIPMLVDRNFDEGFIFTNTSITSEADAMSDLSTLWPEEDGYYAKTIWKMYPETENNVTHLSRLPVYDLLRMYGGINDTLTNSFIRRSAIFGDALVGCPSTYMAQAVAEAGKSVYKLIFNSGYQFHSATDKFLYSNDTYSDGSRIAQGIQIPGNVTVAHLLRKYVISFTLFNDPNSIGLPTPETPEWPRYTVKQSKVLYLANSGVEVLDDPEVSDKCHFLRMGRGNNAGFWPQW